MKYDLIFGSKVEKDLAESFDYYEEQSVGLGADFLLAVDAALSQIQREPLIFQKIYKQKRKVNLKRFPFGVFYVVVKHQVIILAVIHLMRDPKEWKKRKRQ
ncbi:MAG: type II toxin-antitoxin system RelE/ParE family toxin [Bacteroidetes bacterium]|nr:type II toxin-antitoxin system RelE/ParE family toxin [Bacteroidota bacterium]